jgi:hypothetical protein
MAKRKTPPPPGLKVPAHVREICSVSSCISADPPDWITAWRHNGVFLFDSPGLARSVVPATEPDLYEMHAYRVLPLLFTAAGATAWALPDLAVEPLPEDFACLGWDIVGRFGDQFDCSPLSCNGLADAFPVNAACLLERREEALRAVASEAFAGAEPGPYVVAQVWRRPGP